MRVDGKRKLTATDHLERKDYLLFRMSFYGCVVWGNCSRSIRWM